MTFLYLYILKNKDVFMKILKNYTIEKTIDYDFSLLAKELSINKSQFVENKLKEFIKNNIDLLNELKKQSNEK